jgi:hypothetical protein
VASADEAIAKVSMVLSLQMRDGAVLLNVSYAAQEETPIALAIDGDFGSLHARPSDARTQK